MICLFELAEQQKSQRALEINKRILRQTHDRKIAKILSPIRKKLDDVNQSTEKLDDIVKDSTSDTETPQLPIENVTGTQS